MSKKKGEYEHMAQTGERIKTLFTDGTWDLVEDVNKTKGNLPVWLIHRCPTLPVKVQRYNDIIHLPCGFCGDLCPVPLQGLYNMVKYL
jgi:hypothetical protein